MINKISLPFAFWAAMFASGAVVAEVLNLAELNTREIAELDRDTTVVIIPGGILEQHGPYLPSFSDGYVNIDESRQLATDLSEREWTVVMFPVIPLGAGGANEIGGHHSYPGTFAIRPETLRAVFMDIAMELGEQDFRYVFIIHKHGAPDHNVALDQASQFFRDEYGGQMHNLSGFAAGLSWTPELLSKVAVMEEGLSIHAGAMETSQVMHLKPELVSDRVTSAEPVTGKDFAELIEIAKDPEWAGYFGSPRWARPEIGKAIVEKRYRRYLKLALHVLDGGDPSELPGVSKYNSPANMNPTVSKQNQEWYAKRAKRQQEWINQTGVEL
jgi:creatinine amidohydrolase/Fe(II)-dependent formamide hydrolase-like protein